MSKNIFNSKNLGDYYFFLHYIELNDERIGISSERAQEIILKEEEKKLSQQDILFLKTYVHEATHLLDSSASLWGIEYSVRLINCLNNIDENKYVEVFALNHSEIELHKDLLSNRQKLSLEYREMRSILSYDKEHGVHLQFYYYGFSDGSFKVIHKTPVSMLSVLEGHAFVVEQLKEIELYELAKDLVSLKLLEKKCLDVLCVPDITEYTCLLAFTEQLYPNLDFKKKLILIDIVCRFSLNLPSIGFSFPSVHIDNLFRYSDPELVSSLKMELNRGMNRSSLFCLVLIVIKYNLDAEPIIELTNFESQISVRVRNIFRRENQTDIQLKELFLSGWSQEYDFGCQVLDEKGFKLASKIAKLNKDNCWQILDLKEVFLPAVGMASGLFINARNPIDFNIEEHFYNYSNAATQLNESLKIVSKKKPHLSPKVYHSWLTDITQGNDNFIKFYEE